MANAISVCDHTQTPPEIDIPRIYNAARDLMERNIQAGRSDKLAYIDDNGECTYGELDRRSNRFGSALASLGLLQEQRLFLCALDSIDWPVAFLGAIKAGVVPVAVNTLLTPKDYAYMLRDCRAKVAVISPHLCDEFEPFLEEIPTLEALIIADKKGIDSHISIHQLEERGSDQFESPATTSDDPCFWLYSSGSTGAPKGTVHIHSSMIYTAELFGRQILKIDENDRIFSAAKLFFAYGLGNALSFPLAFGATTVLMAERPTPDAVFKRLVEHQPTVFCGVPTLYAGMLASKEIPNKEELAIRIGTSAGEALPAELQTRWRNAFGTEIIDGIGSTEMLHVYLSNRIDDVRPGTTGTPVPGYEIRLVDIDGNEVPKGEIGDLEVSGPSSAIMYWNNRGKTTATFKGRWTHSGDKYYINDEGSYVYAGRSDDMLKVSGIYVSPAEVEATLIQHPAVLEAAVIGAKQEDELIKPKAYIVLNEGFEASDELNAELKDFVKSQLAPYKYPRWFVYVEELPKTATGKIQRFKLRQLEE